MTDDDNLLERVESIDRRKFVSGVGAGMAAGLAGCSSSEPTPTDGGGGTTETETATPTAAEKQEGGKPILGMSTAPNNLNPLASSTAYSFTILENIYTFGTSADPKTGQPIPAGFESWELNVDNVGSSSPTIVAEMRDDLEFNDGEAVTAEDYKFTVEYVKEQEAAGTVAASQFSSVESVEVDSPDGTTVNFFLSEKDRAWLTDILGNIFLPKHIWKDVSDYKKYTPRNAEEGIVGSGPFELTDFNWENWYELDRRDKSVIPWNEAYDFLDSDGPFIDTIRFEVFGSESALNQAILDGNIDQTYGGIKVEKAAEATNTEGLAVRQSQDDGWGHLSWNLRRVPFDDPAFRQLLVKMLDKQWVVESLYKGIGAEKGTYATPKAYTDWRPPEPSEAGGSFEGITIPDLSYPGEQGKFNLSDGGIQAARDFLQNNDQAKYEYSIGEAASDKVAGSEELYLDGTPLSEAHTNNAGEAGQGPLEISLNPPNKAPKTSELISQLVEDYRKVGIPVVKAVESFNSQLPKVYSNENFDMFEMGWTGIGWNNDHYTQLYSSEGADLDGSADAQLFNPMGYTGADELIQKQAGLMDPEPRKPIVKKVLAQIYNDAPTNILQHERVLQPVTKRFGGRVKVTGGVTNPFTWLNIYKTNMS